MTKLSMRQIAKLANVSPSTVSRALKDHPGISDETKRRIRAIIQQHEQKPIGIAIANPAGGLSDDNFFSEVIQGASEYLKQEDQQLLLETFDGDGKQGLPAMVNERQVSGLIVGGIPIADSLIHELLATKLPVVFIGKYLQDSDQLPSVISDNVVGGKLAGEHLADCGYEDFYFLGGSLSTNTFADRLKGFKEGLESRGKTLKKDHILISSMDQKGGYESSKRVLESPPSHSIGIFASTDWMAAGVIRALQQTGMAIPDTVGVVGYSDLDLARYIYPTLTSIRVEKTTMGYLAARTLLDQINGRITEPVQCYLRPRLITRETTKTLHIKEVTA